MGITATEKYASIAYDLLKSGNNRDAYPYCVSCYKSFRNNPEELKYVQDYEKVGVVLLQLMAIKPIDDIDIEQRIASVAFLLLSIGVRRNQSNTRLRALRFVIMHKFTKSFQYTVMSILDNSIYRQFSESPSQALMKMIFYDIDECPQMVCLDPTISRMKNELDELISTGGLGGNRFNNQRSTPEKIVAEGKEYMSKLISYLEEKIFINEDIDFD